MAPKKKTKAKAAADAPEPAAPHKKRSRRAAKRKDEDNKPEAEEVEKIDGVRVYSEAKIRALVVEHTGKAIQRLRDKHSILVLPGHLALTFRDVDDSAEAIFLDTQVRCDWEYTYKNDKNASPSGKQAWTGYTRQLVYQAMNPSMQIVYACMVGYVLENLACCRASVPFLRSHKPDAEIRILSVAVSKDVSKKPKTRRLPTEEGQKSFIVLAQISATAFVVHPGPNCFNKRMQYPTASIALADTTGGTRKRQRAAKTDEAQSELPLPDDIAEINGKSGKHRSPR